MICETLTLEEQAQLAVRHQPRQLSHLGVNEFVHTHIEHMRTRALAHTHAHTNTYTDNYSMCQTIWVLSAALAPAIHSLR